MNNEKRDVQTDEFEQLVVFELDKELYGVDIAVVNTIIRMQSITTVPNMPDFVEGIIDLRGSIIPIIDLRKRFHMTKGEITRSSRIVVVEASGQIVGLVVDAVIETLRIPCNAIEPPPTAVTCIDARYVRAIGKLENRLLILLDLDRVLIDGEVNTIGEIHASSADAKTIA